MSSSTSDPKVGASEGRRDKSAGVSSAGGSSASGSNVVASNPGGATAKPEASRAPANAEPIDESTLDEQTARALRFVRNLLAQMGMKADVYLAPDDGEAEDGEDEIRLEIEGPDAGRVIGKKGAVLEAIQYLTMRVVHRAGGRRRHVSVDAEGYRARHEDQLAQMARRLASRVAVEGKIITFDPMSARDRRIVHMALRDIKGVRTESTGEEPERRIQIIPVRGTAGAAGGASGAGA